MKEIADLISSLGVPVTAMIALAVVLYKIGTVCGTLLIEAWRAKDTKVGELETRVNAINNGQREALESRLDVSIQQTRESTEALGKVSGCLDRLGRAFEEFAATRPCLTDSDAKRIAAESGDEITPDPKTLRTVAKRQAREANKHTEG